MFFIFSALGSAEDLCGLFYQGPNDCPVCISHFIDYHCGWCNSSNQCQSIDQHTCSDDQFLYGPNAKCGSKPVPPIPTPTPVPSPTPLPSDCSIFDDDDDVCGTCTAHSKDRNCGYCAETKKCISIDEGIATCPYTQFYYSGKAECGDVILPPVDPWPQYEVNTSYCASLSGTWCSNCISKNPNYTCGWCGATKECMMSKLDGTGPLLFKCEKDWSSTEDNKCKGIASHKTIVGLRVGIGIFVGIITIAAVISCVYVIRSKPRQINEDGYEQVK